MCVLHCFCIGTTGRIKRDSDSGGQPESTRPAQVNWGCGATTTTHTHSLTTTTTAHNNNNNIRPPRYPTHNNHIMSIITSLTELLTPLQHQLQQLQHQSTTIIYYYYYILYNINDASAQSGASASLSPFVRKVWFHVCCFVIALRRVRATKHVSPWLTSAPTNSSSHKFPKNKSSITLLVTCSGHSHTFTIRYLLSFIKFSLSFSVSQCLNTSNGRLLVVSVKNKTVPEYHSRA